MSLYLLYRVSSFSISNPNALMIGFSLATVIVISIYGVASGRANLSEASLMVIVISLFLILTYLVFVYCIHRIYGLY